MVLPVITSLSADLPAKAEVQGMVGHSGYFGCGYCLQKGDPIKKDSRSKAVVRFISKTSPIRTHEDIINAYAKLKSGSINGIKSVSCMVAAYYFDLVNGFSIDYMHCILLGIVRKLVDLWLNTENNSQPFYISKKKKTELIKRILAIKPISEIARKPRSLDQRKEFKANLLLYYLRFCLTDLLPARYIDHFQLLSSAIYILLKEQISKDDLAIAETRLIKFVDQFEDLYGKYNVTMNLHLIRHILNSVRHLGPLWAQSTFSFETENDVLVNFNHARKDFLQNIACKYIMKKTLVGERIESEKLTLGPKKNAHIFHADFEELKKFGVDPNFSTFHFDISLGTMKIKSIHSQKVSTIDYFIKLNSGDIGSVNFFLNEDQVTYVFAQMYERVESTDHIDQIQPTKINKLFKIDDIFCKMIYMKIGKNEFVTSVPNRFEKT